LRHYELTLPWVSDPHATRQEGARLLPHLITERYMSEMAALKRAAINQLEEFLAAYPDLIVQAKANLGSMVGNTTYPTVEELRSSFRVHFDFEPLPAASNFQGLDDFMLERLTKGLQKKQQRQVVDASAAMWKRAAKPVRKLIERLENADTTIKEPTIEALREIVTLLPGWNLTGDPQMAEVTEEINELISGLDAKTLRTNEVVRSEVIAGAKRVQDKLVQWGL
jgi:glycyl-tRNA synthetase beta subunit